MTDAVVVAEYRDALRVAGQPVSFTRTTGDDPRTAAFSATVWAQVQDVVLQELGSGIAAERKRILALSADLARRGFPLPLRRGDTATIGGRVYHVESVDPDRRAYAGALEIVAAG